jgi:teichuronic acid biosynthesis glycosyltransferase TuaC
LFEAAGPDWKVNVTPVSGAEAITKTERFLSRADRPIGFVQAANKRYAAVARPMRLSPEGASLDELKALTELLIDDGTPIMTFTIHSTSLTVGANPYAKTAEDVESLLQTTREYFDWFKENGGEFISFDDLKTLYRNCA